MDGLTRRAFLGSAAALSVVQGSAAVRVPFGKARLRFGVVSDIHIASTSRVAQFEGALAYFKERGADAVVIGGDVADWGTVEQLWMAADAWRRVFPEGRGKDGRHVEPIAVYGNHELDGKAYQARNPAAQGLEYVADDPKGAWKKIFGTDYETIFEKTVNGYSFVCVQWDMNGGYMSRSGDIDRFLEARRAWLAGVKPFFYVAHVHPYGTVGEMCSAYDYGGSTAALSKFPNAIALTGHSHSSLTDERMLWQGSFTSLGTASLGYVIPYSGRENGRGAGTGGSGREQMPSLPLGECRQGMFATAYDDVVVFERIDFANGGRKLGADWVVSVPADGSLALARRREVTPAPAFAEGAAITVARRAGKDRRGRVSEQIVVVFPAAVAGGRAFDYEVTGSFRVRDVAATVVRRVFSRHYGAAPEVDVERCSCVFARDEFPAAGQVAFSVRPVDSFGRFGASVSAAPFKL